ncbi:MAG: hypothetical protein GX140_06485 [Bacteroidales bacterium]|nr:hypothetical protein [Bacteroidales bacterium]
MKRVVLFIFFLLNISVFAQKNVAGFGIFVEPIIPLKMFRISSSEIYREGAIFTSKPLSGYTLGTHVMVGISPYFSLETGINYVSRDFKISMLDGDFEEGFYINADNFEIPFTVTYNIRLLDKLYMGHSLGVSLQLIPSNLYKRHSERDQQGVLQYSFEHMSFRKAPIYPTFKGGFGFEYRTKEHGYFYIGPVYHLFSEMYVTKLSYYHKERNRSINNLDIKTVGDYFGIQIRYTITPKEFKRSKIGLPDYSDFFD